MYDASKDRYLKCFKTVDHPQRRYVPATLSDVNDLATYGFGLKCNAAGTVMFLPVGNYQLGDETPQKWVAAAGDMIPIQVARVFANGTTIAAADLQVWFQ